jgi:DNA-binding CsgD family transcriptional regulator
VQTLLERGAELLALEALLDAEGGVVLIEGRAGIGKTSLLENAAQRATARGWDVLSARGSELEVDFAFGVVYQLFERHLVTLSASEREAVFAGPAGTARRVLSDAGGDPAVSDATFAVLHGLYWLAANFAARRPLLLAIDDAHWADEPSLRWLAYLAARLEGLPLALVVALRPSSPGVTPLPLLALRTDVKTILRPGLLSEVAVDAVVRASAGARAPEALSTTLYAASGGNPFYLTELLRAASTGVEAPADGVEGILQRVVARVRGLGPHALALAQSLAVMGDGCELRHAAELAGLELAEATRLTARLMDEDILSSDVPPRFVHPVVRDVLEASLDRRERDAAHRSAARVRYADGALPGQVAAHLMAVRPLNDSWVTSRLEEAAQSALEGGAPGVAARLLDRALAEPAPDAERVRILRTAARADASAGRATASQRLEEALRRVADPRGRAEIALETAEVYAALFRWVDAVDVIERAQAELGAADDALAARLQGELVVAGLHDARSASRVAPVLARLAARQQPPPGEAVAVAQGMARFLASEPAADIAAPLEQTLRYAGPHVENWDTRAALLWVLVACERFAAVEDAVGMLLGQVHRSGSARGFVAAYSTLGLLHLRLGALPEADSAARVAMRVLQQSDFAPGLPFAATVLADVAIEAGDYAEAQSLLELLPRTGWPAGVGTVLIPAAWGRLRLAQGHAADALADFEACLMMFGPDVWGMPIREAGYVHARSGAALALIRLGNRERACEFADAELADVRRFGAPRALGIALRAAGLAHGGEAGIRLLLESVTALRNSPALLERARSLAELGGALRRDGRRSKARESLVEALDLAARCGARPLVARIREELKAAGGRPRREWRTGVEALTPSELRIARMAAEGASNRDIAQELYITLKTVEGHLARAYAKLGIERRGELAPTLAGEKTRVATL